MAGQNQHNETEIKLRVGSAAEAIRRLAAAGFRESKARGFETNELLDSPEAPLRERGEVLRLREFRGEAVVTYKGRAAAGGRHKSREELETRVNDGAAMRLIFARLGYQSTYRYEKFRTEFVRPGEIGGDDGVATVDETPIGVFMELEGTPAWIDRMAAAMGFADSEFVTDSYSTLYRQHCDAQGIEVGEGMVFSSEAPGRH